MAVGWGYIRIVEQKRRWQGPTIFHWFVEEQALSGIITPARNEEIKNLSSGFPISELKRNLPSKLPGISLEILNPRVYHISHHLQKSLLLHCLRQGSFQPFIERFHTAHGPIFFGVGLKKMVFQTIGAPKHGWKPEERGSWMKKIPSDTIYCKNTNPYGFRKKKNIETNFTDRSDIGTKLGYFIKTSVGWSFSRAFPPYRSIQAPSLVAQSLRMASCAAALPWTVCRSSSCALLRSSRANSRSRAAWTWGLGTGGPGTIKLGETKNKWYKR